MRLERQLGEGATSTVWLGRTQSEAQVAFKIGRSSEHTSLFWAEAERLIAVDAAASPRLVDAGLVEQPLELTDVTLPRGAPVLVLELAEGKPLRASCERSPVDRVALALSVARDVGEALDELHAAGLSHGDVKPDNIVISETNGRFRARLVDLGLGAALDARVPGGGTRRYLAPEAELGTSDGKARDLWALGVTLAEVVDDEFASGGRNELSLRSFGSDLAPILEALLRKTPGARPSAAWVRRHASFALGETETKDSEVARRRRMLRRTYLNLRQSEVAPPARPHVAVSGLPGEWLRGRLALLERVRALSPAGGGQGEAAASVLRDLDDVDRARWLMRLMGPRAAAFRAASGLTDGELAERLQTLLNDFEPESLTLSMIELGGTGAGARVAAEPLEFALALGSGAATPALLDRIERWVFESARTNLAPPEGLIIALSQSLRLRGEHGRALTLLGRTDSPSAIVEAAETARRAGDRALAETLLARLPGAPLERIPEARRLATLARIELASGRARAALALTTAAPHSAASLEARALAEIALGAHADARLTIDTARELATNDEERARIAGVAGTLAHAAGDADEALSCFRGAAEYAARACAVLEEATYLTGVAAAATYVGALGEALAAARRANLLFEYLGRPGDAARALLSQANVYAAAGVPDESRDAADEAIARAREALDARCEAYAELVLCDISGNAEVAAKHASRARALLTEPNTDETLWLSARLLGSGVMLDLPALDARARESSASAHARLEWWAARATLEARGPLTPGSFTPLAELGALANARAPRAVVGAALASGARLALGLGEAESAERLLHGAREAARELFLRAPPHLSGALSSLDWVTFSDAMLNVVIAPEQVGHIERLIRALARRDRLRPLFEQVLDSLVLWTGVERGLLLLRAPGRRLVVRAGRNLVRSNLSHEQVALSHSLAERALAEREPVVATDAAGELPQVHASVHALKLRSVLAVPLVARGDAFGVVYLDDRVRRGAFGAKELSWVRLLASLAALAIADARDQLLLRRAARRAERAERRLVSELAAREVELEQAERELSRTRDGRATRFAHEDVVGQSAAVIAMLKVVDRVTLSDVPVLVQGESGTGKELVARAIHANGARASRPFVSENCAAIPESLLESALFGHVRGAFTGASRPRAGLFEVADGGTLFLDEIAEMSLGMQTKLLRVLEEGELRPLGSERTRRVNVRVIGATHRNLEERVKTGLFREDLYYRLNVIAIRVPPLREREGDVPLLVHHFVTLHAGERKVRVTKGALDAWASYAWPGNIRQLENEVRRALVLADTVIELEHVSKEIADRRAGERARADGLNVRERVDALETELVKAALRRTSGNQTKAAELLGLSRFGLQKMMKRLEIPFG